VSYVVNDDTTLEICQPIANAGNKANNHWLADKVSFEQCNTKLITG